MKRRTAFALVVALPSAVAGLGPAAFAADDVNLEGGYELLFNGKDLSGWKYGQETLDGKTATSDGRYKVIDGIFTVMEGQGIKQIFTVREFPTDFHLKLEFRAAKNADSGLFVRKPQLQVRDYPRAGPFKMLKNYKDGDWNEIDVTVTGNVARCLCNNEVIAEAMKLPAGGGIGLEADRGKMEYRRIRIKAVK
jgi:hypothetical protein